jgi:hypothetical protein
MASTLVADTIIRPGHTALWLAEQMVKDVSPDLFARKPHFGTGADAKVIDANHPAFVYGHLATYPIKLLQMCGVDATAPAVIMPPAYAELFSAGKECRDDPDNTIYPSMAEINEQFFGGYRHALEAISTVSDEVFTRPNPAEGRMKAMFPTVGPLVNFMVGSHIMMHLGQVSTWRRCFGLGPVM